MTTGTPMPLPKLLFYTHGLVDGGAERLWACLATAFKQRGYDVTFVQDFEADDNRANLDPSIPLITLGPNHSRATWRLSKLLAELKPAIALSAIGSCNTKLLLALAHSRAPTKAVITYHGYNEWKTGWLSWLAYIGLPLLSRFASRTVAVSTGLREELIRRWGARDDKVVTIHNPVFFPAQAAVPTSDELRAREPVVLAVGRFVAEKDFVTLIRAFARLKTRGARLVILGKGPHQALLEGEVRRHGLTGRVAMPGYSREPWKYYAAARCFALSSVSEPFGNVVVEAMAYGLPVVATACPGPLEILKYGRFGRIVPLKDDVQLAQALDKALADPGDPAVQRARADDFSFAVRVPAYEKLIEEIINAPLPLADAVTGTVASK
ncbi:MAG: glycosyltransferase [Hyphomicrobiaceae bacterium]